MWGVEAAAEDDPPGCRNQVHREPTPAGGEFVEHLAGLLGGGPGDLLEPLHEPRRRQHLVLDQPRRLVFRSEQPQFDAFDRQARPPKHKTCEFPGAFARRVLQPLLPQLRHLGRLARYHPGTGRVLAKDAALNHLRRTIGFAAREQADDLHPGGQAARHPEHAHRNDGSILATGFELVDKLCNGACGGLVLTGQLQHLDVGIGMLPALPAQPVVEQVELGG
jgi:hypothetical protein